MRYKLESVINLPREKVAKLFSDSKNYKSWQPELESIKLISGQKGKVNSKSIMKVKIGKKLIEITETIIKSNLPNEISFTYEAKGAWNENKNYFIKLAENKTKWIQENEFRCSGFLKVMAFFMPGMFRRDTIKHMRLFKEFAEKN